jgi:hypothetical protein
VRHPISKKKIHHKKRWLKVYALSSNPSTTKEEEEEEEEEMYRQHIHPHVHRPEGF